MAKPADKNSVVDMAKKLYEDPFVWSFVKSWAFFAGGIFVARHVISFDGAVTPSP